MNIDEAVKSLATHLGDPEIFSIRHSEGKIIVNVLFIYRVKDVEALNGIWQGFTVELGRKSCW